MTQYTIHPSALQHLWTAMVRKIFLLQAEIYFLLSVLSICCKHFLKCSMHKGTHSALLLMKYILLSCVERGSRKELITGFPKSPQWKFTDVTRPLSNTFAACLVLLRSLVVSFCFLGSDGILTPLS